VLSEQVRAVNLARLDCAETAKRLMRHGLGFSDWMPVGTQAKPEKVQAEVSRPAP
jgi:hypothetical protein